MSFIPAGRPATCDIQTQRTPLLNACTSSIVWADHHGNSTTLKPKRHMAPQTMPSILHQSEEPSSTHIGKPRAPGRASSGVSNSITTTISTKLGPSPFGILAVFLSLKFSFEDPEVKAAEQQLMSAHPRIISKSCCGLCLVHADVSVWQPCRRRRIVAAVQGVFCCDLHVV